MLSGDDTLAASVVIPTYNRSALLRDTLASLERQDAPAGSFEVIVADDGSSDDTEQVARRSAERAPVRYVWQPDEGHRPGAARNLGAAAARGKVLIFLDTGTVAGPEFVAGHLAAHEADSDVAVLGYAYGYNPWITPPHAAELTAQYSPEQLVQHLEDDPGFRDLRHDTFARVGDDLDRLHLPWLLFWTANVSVRAARFRALGGFHDGFEGWGCEDVNSAFGCSAPGCVWRSADVRGRSRLRTSATSSRSRSGCARTWRCSGSCTRNR